MFSMMCPGISYSTVHSLMFHTNGSVQNNKLFKEFCNKNQAHFSYGFSGPSITDSSFHNDSGTLTLLDQPEELKYDDSRSPITREYEVITTFIKINNISATWGAESYDYGANNPTSLLRVGSFWCQEGLGWECCPPM